MIIKKDIDEIQNYFTDAANYKGICDAVYFPENISDVSTVLKEANSGGNRVTVSGGGTGITGSRVPEGGIVLSTERLNRIINISHASIITEPGVVLADLQSEVESKKLFYPPDPTERNCFIGGTIATNASGAKTLKYGSTRNYVESLQIILPEGDLLTLKRNEIFADKLHLVFTSDSGKRFSLNLPEMNMPKTKNASGYFLKPDMDLVDLFIGSEGTLGVITQAKLKLLPIPENIISAVIFFDNVENALNFVMESDNIKHALAEKSNPDLHPTGIEFFDRRALDFLRDLFPQIPEGSDAAIWFEEDSPVNVESHLNIWHEFIEKHHGDLNNSWIATSPAEREKFKDFRHAVSWKVNESMAQKGLRKVGTDTAVPKKNFRQFFAVINDLAEQSNIDYLVYGHFGNYHPHLNLLPRNEEEFKRAKELYHQICLKSIELEGTVSAEHGIGKMKHQYLLDMYGEEVVRGMAVIKKKLDPNLILGIGNIFSLDHLK